MKCQGQILYWGMIPVTESICGAGRMAQCLSAKDALLGDLGLVSQNPCGSSKPSAASVPEEPTLSSHL